MAMKQVSTAGAEHRASPSGEMQNSQREQIPLRDLSECLLAAYEGVMQRACRLLKVRGAELGSELKNWKEAEHDLLGAMPVDLAESEENYYALASVPGYEAVEISVAVEDRWLLISGYGRYFKQAELATGEAEFIEACATISCSDTDAAGLPAEHAYTLLRTQFDAPADERFEDCIVRRPFCVVELGRKVDAARTVAVFANGLVAVRMANAAIGETTPTDKTQA